MADNISQPTSHKNCTGQVAVTIAALTTVRRAEDVPALAVCRMEAVTSLDADELTGRSLYQFCHVNDIDTLRQAHIEGNTKYNIMPPPLG